jgi:hypothetical protein
MKLTRSQLLDKMEEGQRYTATSLAQAFGKPTYTMRELLLALVREGFVTRCDDPSRVMRFQRTAGVVSADDVESRELHDTPTTSVATFPIRHVFGGTLTDYDLNAHRMLAMLTRR